MTTVSERISTETLSKAPSPGRQRVTWIVVLKRRAKIIRAISRKTARRKATRQTRAKRDWYDYLMLGIAVIGLALAFWGR
jgi:hypothetical protein